VLIYFLEVRVFAFVTDLISIKSKG